MIFLNDNFCFSFRRLSQQHKLEALDTTCNSSVTLLQERKDSVEKKMLRVCRKQCILLSIICLVAIFLGLTLFQTDSENLNDIKQRLNLPVQDKIKENVFHRKYSWVKRFTHGRNVTVTTPRTKALVKIDEEILKMIRDIHNKMVAVNVSVKPFKISCTEKSIDGTEDLLCMVRSLFICFIGIYCNRPPVARPRLFRTRS